MKKSFEFYINEGRLIVNIQMKKVESISAINTKKGVFELLEMQGFLFSLENKLIHSGNLSNYLPEDNEIALKLKMLWDYNISYVYGTLNQLECIGHLSLEDLIKSKDKLENALNNLKHNNLLIDRGIYFGNKKLINPLPKNILEIANNLLVA